MKECFPVITHRLHSLFQNKLYQSTNMYHDDGNENRLVVTVEETLTIHLTIILLMLVCGCHTKTSEFP